MANYMHGAYGSLTDSIVESSLVTTTVPVYFGTAPVNLIRGYAEKDIVNAPTCVTSLANAQQTIGYSDDWKSFTLCEAVAAHYNTASEPVGPIYLVNVLDPSKHKAKTKTTKTIGMANGVASFASDLVILDTLTVTPESQGETATTYTEGEDYTITYNFSNASVVITAIEDGTMTDGNIVVTYFEVTPESVTAADIVGSVSEDGAYSGIEALALLYQKLFAVPNLLLAPGWSEDPTVYKKLVSTAQKINGHWDAFVLADIPLVDGKNAVDTISKALAWQATNAYTSERSAVCWPQVIDHSGHVYHLSTLYAVECLRTDNEHDGVPFETCSNKAIPVSGQYFGEASTNRGFDQVAANKLNESGITSAIGWAGEWVLWGPHTAAYKHGSTSMDARSVFAPSMRMLMHITNGFQIQWAPIIDEPMTRTLRDRIINAEQAKLDGYVTQGALIGEPTIVFDESHNPSGSIVEGNFRWDIAVTPTPPLKSASVYVAYSEKGFSAYFEEGE